MNYTIIRPPLHKDFELPSREKLLGVHSDQLVKIIFQVGDETPERMWVKVVKQTDSEWRGILDNDPVGDDLKKMIGAGDEVVFHPLDVIQIWE